jgi:hypothetical protein
MAALRRDRGLEGWLIVGRRLVAAGSSRRDLEAALLDTGVLALAGVYTPAPASGKDAARGRCARPGAGGFGRVS